MQGSLQGSLVLHYFTPDESVFTGMQHFVGTLDNKQGGFTCVSQGQYKDKVVTCEWRILPGSGTGQLVNIVGSGGYTTGHQQSVAYQLDYQLSPM